MRGLAAFFVVTMLASASANAAPLQAYGQLPSLEDVAISPDGSKLAFVKQFADGRAVIVQSSDTGELIRRVNIHEAKLRGVVWADSTHLMMMTSVTGYAHGVRSSRSEWSMIQSLDVTTGDQVALLTNVSKAMNIVAGVPQVRIVNGQTHVLPPGIYFPDRTSVSALFSVQFDSTPAALVDGQLLGASDWVIDEQGNLIAESGYNEDTKQWSIFLRKGDDWKDVYDLSTPIDMPWIEGLSPDGQSIVFHVPDDGNGSYKTLSLQTGAPGAPFRPGEKLGNLFVDPLTGKIIGAVLETTKLEYTFFSPEVQSSWDRIESSFPQANVRLQSRTADWKKAVIEVSGPNDGDVYALADLVTGKTIAIGPVHEGLVPADFAPVTAIEYQAADGLTIPAYLTLPKRAEQKNLPLVVLPHGGPAAHDNPGFDWWAQALASRGYAVLQPEFRGSDGFGHDFLAGGFGQFGRKMQTDLSDGVRALVWQGIVDPKRVCIVGASYGGYAALAGVTLQSGIYRCAVSVGGVSDLRKFMRWIADKEHSSEGLSIRFWDRFTGTDSPNDPTLDIFSPARQAALANAPVLLIHGKDDTVVPPEQSELMEEKLKDADKPVQFVELENEDHWLSRSDTRFQMLDATVKFLEANNPP